MFCFVTLKQGIDADSANREATNPLHYSEPPQRASVELSVPSFFVQGGMTHFLVLQSRIIIYFLIPIRGVDYNNAAQLTETFTVCRVKRVESTTYTRTQVHKKDQWLVLLTYSCSVIQCNNRFRPILLTFSSLHTSHVKRISMTSERGSKKWWWNWIVYVICSLWCIVLLLSVSIWNFIFILLHDLNVHIYYHMPVDIKLDNRQEFTDKLLNMYLWWLLVTRQKVVVSVITGVLMIS